MKRFSSCFEKRRMCVRVWVVLTIQSEWGLSEHDSYLLVPSQRLGRLSCSPAGSALVCCRSRRRFEGSAAAPFHWNLMSANKRDRKSTRLNSSHVEISYAVFCL